MQPDFDKSAAAMVAGTNKAIAAAVAPLLKRIEALETRPLPERGEKGDRGEQGLAGREGVGLAGALIDRSGVLVLTLTDGTTRDLGVVVGKDGMDGDDGKDANELDDDAFEVRVKALLASQLEAVSNGVDTGFIADEVARAVASLPPVPAGAEVDLDVLRAEINQQTVEQIAKALGELPPLPELPELELPRSVSRCLLGKDGDLIVTYSDGTTDSLGRVVAQDADMAAIERQIREMVEALPKPKDGRDGFNLEDFDIVPNEDGRTIEMKFQRGDIVHSYELVFPVAIDRGVYKEGEVYAAGDGVTWGGSWWIAQRETSAKPDGVDSHWRLAVKRGRDGKDGKDAKTIGQAK